MAKDNCVVILLLLQRYTSVAVGISMTHQVQAQLPLNSQSDLIDSGLGSVGAEDNHGTQYFPGFTVQHDRGHDQELLEAAANAPRPRAVQHEELSPAVAARPVTAHNEVQATASVVPRPVVVAEEVF